MYNITSNALLSISYELKIKSTLALHSTATDELYGQTVAVIVEQQNVQRSAPKFITTVNKIYTILHQFYSNRQLVFDFLQTIRLTISDLIRFLRGIRPYHHLDTYH